MVWSLVASQTKSLRHLRWYHVWSIAWVLKQCTPFRYDQVFARLMAGGLLVPSGTGPKAEHAEWILSGTMKIRTRGSGKLPN